MNDVYVRFSAPEHDTTSVGERTHVGRTQNTDESTPEAFVIDWESTFVGKCIIELF